MGKEPLLDAGRVLGHATSANYGYTMRTMRNTASSRADMHTAR
jgi:hypothetical protein